MVKISLLSHRFTIFNDLKTVLLLRLFLHLCQRHSLAFLPIWLSVEEKYPLSIARYCDYSRLTNYPWLYSVQS